MSKLYSLTNLSRFGTTVDAVRYGTLSLDESQTKPPTLLGSEIKEIIQIRNKRKKLRAPPTAVNQTPNQDIRQEPEVTVLENPVEKEWNPRGCWCDGPPDTSHYYKSTAPLDHGSVIHFGCLHFTLIPICRDNFSKKKRSTNSNSGQSSQMDFS